MKVFEKTVKDILKKEDEFNNGYFNNCVIADNKKLYTKGGASENLSMSKVQQKDGKNR